MSPIDVHSLKKAWRDFEVDVLVEVPDGEWLDGDEIRELCGEVADELDERNAGRELGHRNGTRALTWARHRGGGWAGCLVYAFSVDGFVEFLELLLARLGDGATARGLTEKAMPFSPDLTRCLAAYGVFPAPPMPEWSENMPLSNWTLNPELTRQAAQYAQDWMYRRGDATVVEWRPNRSFATNDPDLGRVAMERLTHDSGFYFAQGSSSPWRMRTCAMSRCSAFAWAVEDPDLDWRATVAELRTLLTDQAADLGTGFVAHAKPISHHPNFAGQVIRPPYVHYSYLETATHDIGRRVQDAYGLQLLTGGQLSLIHDRSRWKVEQVADDRYLLTALDLEPWYAGQEPDPRVLEQARSDLDAIIARP